MLDALLDPDGPFLIMAAQQVPEHSTPVFAHQRVTSRTEIAEVLASKEPDAGGDVKPARKDAMRQTIYRYMELPYHTRVAIAQKLEVLEKGDEQLADIEKFKRVIKRVCERGIRCEFRIAIDRETERLCR